VRAAYVIFAVLVLGIGVLFIVSPLTRGLGFTFGSLIGVLLVLASAYRLARELRPRNRSG